MQCPTVAHAVLAYILLVVFFFLPPNLLGKLIMV